MRFVWDDKRFYGFAITTLIVLFFLTLVQNYIRYQHHSSYSIWTSIVYLLVSILCFLPVIIGIVHLFKEVKSRWSAYYWLINLGFGLITLVFYYVISNFVLHSLGYFDAFIDSEYARYYFGREALYHLLLIGAAAIFVQYATLRKHTITAFKGRKRITLDLNLVQWMEVEGHYLNLHTISDTYVKREGISVMAKKLSSDFVRIHRKYLVNRSEITAVEKNKRDEYVILKNGKKLKVGPSFKPVQW